MMKYSKLYILSLIFLLSACQEFLELKPDAVVSTPETLEDLDALLSYEPRMNENYCGLVEIGADDYQLVRSVYDARTVFEQDSYRWASEPFYLQRDMGENWQKPYETVLYANIVLESLERIKGGNEEFRNRIMGDALFVRAFRFFNLAQAFAPVYDPNTADQEYGIPLRLSSDVTQKTVRSSVRETYGQIVSDLKKSISLLPETVPNKTRPDRAAALALLSRVLLSMQDYKGSLQASLECLKLNSTLMDYNKLDLTVAYPFAPLHPETIYYGKCPVSLLVPSRSDVSRDLYQLYIENDLRKIAFFSMRTPDRIRFKGYYNGGPTGYFGGLATDEVYLNAAECYIRLGNIGSGMEYLNDLLSKRFEENGFVPVNEDNSEEALRLVLEERRKELPFRGIRWTDLRRLNLDPRFAKVLQRKIEADGSESETFSLPPNDPRYVHLIPQSIIELTGIAQNRR